MYPAAVAAAAKCGTIPTCQRTVTMVSDKTAYLWVQTKDGVTYAITAAIAGIAAGALGEWAAGLVSDIAGKDAALPGKPGDVVYTTAPPPSNGDEGKYGPEIPVVPAVPVGPIVVPGQENNGPSGGTTTTSPLPEEPGPGLIFQHGEGVANGIKIVEQHGSIYEFSVPGKMGTSR
ncbi:hypothetical protein D3C71_1555970 [compost metagenome]